MGCGVWKGYKEWKQYLRACIRRLSNRCVRTQIYCDIEPGVIYRVKLYEGIAFVFRIKFEYMDRFNNLRYSSKQLLQSIFPFLHSVKIYSIIIYSSVNNMVLKIKEGQYGG